jgi:hypothetical protein
MWRTWLSAPLILLFVLALAAPARGQLLTITQALARAGVPLMGGRSIPSGPTPPLDNILRRTELIVRGVAGEPRSYLSDDQMDVYSDYPLQALATLYDSAAQRLTPLTLAITVLGGSVTINGLRYTSTHNALPLWPAGIECIFMLTHIGDRYFITGRYYGAFLVYDDAVSPMSRKQGFAPELRGLHAFDAEQLLVSRVKALRGAR